MGAELEEILRLVREHARKRHAPAPFVPGVTPVPYAGRVFDDREIVNAVEASLEFWLTEGRYAERLGRALAEFHGLSDAVLVNSGSSANLVALAALTSPTLGARALRPGDEVVTVAAAFPTTVAAVVQNGLVPVFVDISLETGNALPARVEEAVGPRTRAILLAHTLGNPFDADAVRRIAEDRGLWLVEDNCDALGSRHGGRLTGTFGHLATCSFFPAHHMTTGEGGCVLTNDPRLARIVRSLRDWGKDCHCRPGQSGVCGDRFGGQHGTLPPGYDHKYVYSHIGYNLKMTDLQAAVGCAQIEKLPGFIEARKANWGALRRGLAPLEDLFLLPQAAEKADPSWFGFLLTVRDSAPFSRGDIVRHLERNRIETRNLFAGNILRHPGFAAIPHRVAGTLENTDTVTERTFFVGCYPGLTPEMLGHVVDTFTGFARTLR